MEESGHELWASVGVRLPLDEKDEGDSLENLSMAFCTFLVKFVGKGYLLFSELCFLIPSESPLPSGSSWESLSEVHSSPMSGKVKNRVLGTGPGAIHTLGSGSPGAGSWRGFRGLEAALLLPSKGMVTEGRVAQTAPELGKAPEATEHTEPL